jgi:hypothetical protein
MHNIIYILCLALWWLIGIETSLLLVEGICVICCIRSGRFGRLWIIIVIRFYFRFDYSIILGRMILIKFLQIFNGRFFLYCYWLHRINIWLTMMLLCFTFDFRSISTFSTKCLGLSGSLKCLRGCSIPWFMRVFEFS